MKTYSIICAVVEPPDTCDMDDFILTAESHAHAVTKAGDICRLRGGPKASLMIVATETEWAKKMEQTPMPPELVAKLKAKGWTP